MEEWGPEVISHQSRVAWKVKQALFTRLRKDRIMKGARPLYRSSSETGCTAPREFVRCLPPPIRQLLPQVLGPRSR